MKMFHKRTRVFVYSTVMLSLVLSGCTSQVATLQKTDTAMGTIVSQTLYVRDTNQGSGENISREIYEAIDTLEQNVLSWRLPASELYKINEAVGQSEGVLVSDKLADILEDCLRVSEASGGAFDITIGDVVRLWDMDTWAVAEDTSDFQIPQEDALREVLRDSGYEKISLQGSRLLLPEKLQLDLGAVGKGIALDEIRTLLQEREEVEGAVISVGGSVLTYGSKPGGGTWNVGIVNPAEPSKYRGMLKLSGEWCVSTSGDYERYVEIDGERFHHIIDPATGRPVDSGVRSVTILNKDGLYSDALSTACFILGEEKGMALAREFDAEVLFISEDGSISMTEGMKKYYQE